MRLGIAIVAAVAALLLAAPLAQARSIPQGFYGVMYDHGITRAPSDVQDAQWDLMASS